MAITKATKAILGEKNIFSKKPIYPIAIKILNRKSMAIGPLDFRSSNNIDTSVTATLLNDTAQRKGDMQINVSNAPKTDPNLKVFTIGKMYEEEIKIIAMIIMECTIICIK